MACKQLGLSAAARFNCRVLPPTPSHPGCAWCSQLRFELDFRNEAANAARLARCLEGRADVAVPRLHPELCTSRVLTMEFVSGCRVT